MEQKPVGTKEEQPVVEKKAYTPPALIVYGKLSDMTASGTKGGNEGTAGTGPLYMV